MLTKRTQKMPERGPENIDICLPTLNSGCKMTKLLQTLADQCSSGCVRLLIADGGSTDNTVQKIKDKFSNALFLSLSDKSPEEGINRLLRHESKNAKLLIGSDDWLSPDYVKKMTDKAKELINNGEERFILLPNKFINVYRGISYPSRLPHQILEVAGIGRGIGWMIYCRDGAPEMREDLKYASDYDILVRCKRSNYRFEYVDCTYYHSKDGRSSSGSIRGIWEEFRISCQYPARMKTAKTIASAIVLSIKGISRTSLIVITWLANRLRLILEDIL